jgi:PilZ domain
MLGIDHSKRLESLIDRLDWSIELPPDWSNYFAESGESNVLPNDERQSRRIKVRTLSVLHVEHAIPSLPRPSVPLGVYTHDFSRRGCGFISPVQLLPEEVVRLLLPTLWMRLRIVRARRVGPRCYEIGAELIEQHALDSHAFEGVDESSADKQVFWTDFSRLTGSLPTASNA